MIGKKRGADVRRAKAGRAEMAMTPIKRWIVSFAGVTLASAVAYQWLDRPIALFFHQTVARPETFARLTYAPDPMVPLAIIVFVVLGLMNLSGRARPRPEPCAVLRGLSLTGPYLPR